MTDLVRLCLDGSTVLLGVAMQFWLWRGMDRRDGRDVFVTAISAAYFAYVSWLAAEHGAAALTRLTG